MYHSVEPAASGHDIATPDFEDLSYSEIAELLNQPIGTVKANVHRGIQLLRRALETQMNETR